MADRNLSVGNIKIIDDKNKVVEIKYNGMKESLLYKDFVKMAVDILIAEKRMNSYKQV